MIFGPLIKAVGPAVYKLDKLKSPTYLAYKLFVWILDHSINGSLTYKLAFFCFALWLVKPFVDYSCEPCEMCV